MIDFLLALVAILVVAGMGGIAISLIENNSFRGERHVPNNECGGYLKFLRFFGLAEQYDPAQVNPDIPPAERSRIIF